MKKKIIKIIISVVILVAVAYFVFHPIGFYVQDYYKAIGIKGAHRYCDIIEDKGDPLRVYYDDGNFRHYVAYDGLTFIFDNLEQGAFQSVWITGEQYRFGLWKIGVGTPRSKIESVYRHFGKISGLHENWFGAIDGNTWIEFMFDDYDKVSDIYISSGP